MASELRNTGISIIGEVPWGTHFCHFYETKQDLLDTIIPYFKAGLESNEFCVWIVSTPKLITLEEAKGALAQAVPNLDRHLSDQNIEILNGLEWYLEENVFNLERITRAWDAKLKGALARGYDGMRVSGDTFWLAEKDWNDFFAYEKQLNDSITDQPMTVLCTYPLGKSGAAEVLDVVQAHQFAIARRQGEWKVIETPELVQAKAEIRRLNEELEQRVVGRTGELAKAIEELKYEISERKQSEVELSLAHQRLSYHVENTPLAVIEWDKDLFIKRWSKRAEEVFGWKASETLGINMNDPGFPIVYEEDVQGVAEIAGQLMKGTVSRNPSLNRNYTKDGNVIYCEWYNSLLKDEDGNVITILSLVHDVTERKRAEETLYAREQEFRAIVENAPDPIARYDKSFRRTYVNPAFARSMGLPAEALIGKPIFTSFRDAGLDLKNDELAQIHQRLEDVFNTGKSCEFEVTLPMPTGRTYHSVRFVPELDLGGSVVNVLGISRDVTERKQAEEALDERLRFETLVTELSAAFANLSPNEVDREIEKWLQTLVEFLGVDRATFFQVGEDWRTLYRSHSYTVPGIEPLPPPPIGMKYQFPWIADQMSRGVTVKWSRIPDDMPEEAAREKEYAARLRVKSGLNIPVVVGGSVICAISFTSIVTYHDWPDALVARLRLVGEIFSTAVARKRGEAALRESEEQFRQLAENIRDVFWLRTPDVSAMLYVSHAYENIWGRTRESLYQDPRSFISAIHPEDRPYVVEVIDRDRERGFEVEYRVVRPDGSIRWVWDRGFPIKDESGRFYRVGGIAEDITERKLAEESLKATTEQLRALSARVHSAKEEEGARIARELHDELGSTLTGLKWGLEEIDRMLSSDGTTANGEQLREKIGSMNSLIDSTLDTVRRVSSELRPAILDDVGLAAAIRWQAQQFEARTGIACSFLAPVGANGLSREQSTAVFRIFQEALTNIARHAQATEVHIAINVEDGQFVLTISDNGIGIRANEKVSAEAFGLLGMRERAHLVGGEVTINGSEGRGTVVTVRIPPNLRSGE